MNDKPEFIHEPGIDKARGSASTSDEMNVLAGLLLEGSNSQLAWPALHPQPPALRSVIVRTHQQPTPPTALSSA